MSVHSNKVFNSKREIVNMHLALIGMKRKLSYHLRNDTPEEFAHYCTILRGMQSKLEEIEDAIAKGAEILP